MWAAFARSLIELIKSRSALISSAQICLEKRCASCRNRMVRSGSTAEWWDVLADPRARRRKRRASDLLVVKPSSWRAASASVTRCVLARRPHRLAWCRLSDATSGCSRFGSHWDRRDCPLPIGCGLVVVDGETDSASGMNARSVSFVASSKSFAAPQGLPSSPSRPLENRARKDPRPKRCLLALTMPMAMTPGFRRVWQTRSTRTAATLSLK
jgi:hypothetical protein